MKCPVCQTNLVMSERKGIEIDYCPQCRGVWLDRGELDKIVERSGDDNRPTAPQNRIDHDDDYNRRGGDYRRKKRESFLGDLFDF